MRSSKKDGSNFKEYILSKQLRLLHYIYEQLYSFLQYSKDSIEKFALYEQDEYDSGSAEYLGTQLLSIKDRLRIHSKLYKQLKPSTVILLKNGQHSIFESLLGESV